MTRHTVGAFVLAALGVLVATPLAAHHGNASFDTSKRVTLKGAVTEWIWANPHCFLKIDAMDDSGGVRNTGDHVTVVLEAVKNGAPIGRVVSITLPDGSTLGAGNLPNTPPAGP